MKPYGGRFQIKHGACANGVKTKEYRTWLQIFQRSRNALSGHYYKGVRIWSGWVRDFPAFLAHIGKCPSPQHSIDRIKNHRGYVPGNVRWATAKQQARNRSDNVYLTVNRRKVLLVEACEQYGIPAKVVRDRIKAGWRHREALETAIAPRRKRKK